MIKRLIIHDLSDLDFEALNLPMENTTVVHADGKYAPCQGCFGCWLQTPSQCVLKDQLQHIGKMIATSDEVIIISKNCYGGYSNNIKMVIDRSISACLPFFVFRKGRIHHPARYDKYKVDLVAIFYGDVTQKERETAKHVVEAHGINMMVKSTKTIFVEDLAQIKEEVICE